MSGSNCCFLNFIQVSQETGEVIWYSYRFKNCPKCDPHRKRFCVVNEAEVDVSLEFPCFLHDPMNVGNFISDSSAFSKHSLCIWNFLVYIMPKLSLKDFVHSLASM